MLRYRLLAILLWPVCVSWVCAEDWTQWRGPARDNVWREAGILAAFPPAGLTVRWRVPVGTGWATPVVAAGRVYVTDSELVQPKAFERLHCLDEQSGAVLWTQRVPVNYADWAFKDENKGGPVATPVYDNGKLYTLGFLGNLHCYDAVSGKVLWERDLQKDYPDKGLSCHASPVIDENLLIVFTGAKPKACVAAFDKNTGAEVWKALNEGSTCSSPLIVTAAGKRQVIVWTTDSVSALEPKTGELLWRQALVTRADHAVASPVASGQWLALSGLMLKLDGEKPGSTIAWPANKGAQHRIFSNTSTPLFVGEHLISGKTTGELICVEVGTGKPVWEVQLTDKINGASIHLYPHGEEVYLFTERGDLIRGKVTAAGFTELGRTPLIAPTTPFSGRKCAWVPPAFANRHVIARNDKEVVRMSLEEKP